MGVNSLASPGYGFNDAAVLLNSIVSQATGKTAITATNLQDFISIGQTALSVGPDPLMQAISQVLSRTIFSIRPYSEKFAGLRASALKWGNHVRKLSIADSDWDSDGRFYESTSDFLDNGDSVDMYKINLPNVLQTNFYGQNVVERHVTIFRDQLNVAFSGPDELMQFVSMIMSNVSDQLAQARETSARMALANYIGSKKTMTDGGLGTDHCIYLIDEYNSATSSTEDATTIYTASVYPNFVRWLYGYIATLSNLFTERTIKYQMNVTGKLISRHTPKARQKFYVSAPEINRMRAEVLSNTFNQWMLSLGDVEEVSYWQSPDTPEEIKVTPAYMNASGAIVNASAITVDNIFGVLFDDEAIMTQSVNEWSAPTPFNAKGGYTNTFWHASNRYLNDFTEKGTVLLIAKSSP